MSVIRLLDTIHAIDAHHWNALWNSDYPFIQHQFLAALEESGCSSSSRGWTPTHLVVEEGNHLIAAMPLYLKSHSYGEYVFDWSWADAYRTHGLNYYPKLLNAIPFTPATGPRLATAKGYVREQLISEIHAYLSDYCQQHNISSWHTLFHREADNQLWKRQGLLSRIGCQFHWKNQSFDNFDQYLATFNSRKRKAVRKERKQVADAGVSLIRLCGSDISDRDWELFYRFYHTTYLKRSGNSGYLNREFFQTIANTMSAQILMIKAQKGGQTIAAALCFFDHRHLFGRYWGCAEEIPGLHFEACYYQGIEFAIERKLQIFDPGAQGEHKIQRGFEPVLTYSSHWIADSRFKAAIGDFLRREAPGVHAYQQDCQNYLPFKKSSESDSTTAE